MLLVSCGHQRTLIRLTHEHKPDEDKAIDIVWRYYEEYSGEAYGTRQIPLVEWINKRTVPCGNDECYGIYIPDLRLAVVAWEQSKLTRFSTTSLAHELCHAYFGGGHDTCMNHLPPVETANIRLRELGL